MKDFTATFVVSSESAKSLRAAKQVVAQRGSQDYWDIDIGTAGHRRREERHRIGDYFRSIKIIDDGPVTFRVVFEPRPSAAAYWKDLVVKILLAVRESGARVHSERRNKLSELS